MSQKTVVVLVAGELGSGTTDVGRLLAERIGWPVFNTEGFLKTAAADFRASFEKLASMEKSGEINLESMLRGMVEDQMAAGNSIIEGRSALLVLDKEASLKVFLHKEKQERVALVASRRRIPEEQARDEVEFSDKERSERASLLFGFDWTDSSHYDLTINTSRFSHEQATQMIVAALKMRGVL